MGLWELLWAALPGAASLGPSPGQDHSTCYWKWKLRYTIHTHLQVAVFGNPASCFCFLSLLGYFRIVKQNQRICLFSWEYIPHQLLSLFSLGCFGSVFGFLTSLVKKSLPRKQNYTSIDPKQFVRRSIKFHGIWGLSQQRPKVVVGWRWLVVVVLQTRQNDNV